MGETTLIEWTDATWNPVTGCSVISPGCTNCYAMKLAGGRLRHQPTRQGLTTPTKAGPVWNGQVRLNEAELLKPLGWRRPRKIFVCAHGDLFHESVPDAWIDQVFAVAALCPQHTFQVLTKRADRMRAYMTDRERAEVVYDQVCEADVRATPLSISWPLPNVWLGVSAEDQTRAAERVPHLLDTPAVVHFLSAEPLLGPIDARPFMPELITAAGPAPGAHPDDPHTFVGRPIGLHWVIVGGESGPGARPMAGAWARQLRDDCAEAGVPFFFKQWGEFAPYRPWTTGGPSTIEVTGRFGKKAAGRMLDGVLHDAMPAVRT